MSEKNSLSTNIIRAFLIIGKIEGYSYLFLLFIAMPFKYILHKPEMVKIGGTIHGVLFVAFVTIILAMIIQVGMTLRKAMLAFLLSLVPFGTFYLKKTL
jgi:integral membrane protein